MEKHFLNRQTRDGAQLTIEQIAAICPSAITEVQDENTGEIVRKVNFTTLRQLLGDLSVETPHEAYDFTWVGKTAARREAAMPISQTLRPCPEESVDWDTTKNLYIEGDNLQVLKLLQNYYAGQVKMIYIDPPYNTGKDFVYHDDFSITMQAYDEESGARDEFGNRYFVNTESSSDGRFHSDWCSMMLPRLFLSRTLLSDDGVIFISIDDNEVMNLKKICDEVFGAENFVNIISVNMKNIAGASGGGEDKRLKKNCEYCLIYARNYQLLKPFVGVYEYTPMHDVLQEYRDSGKSWHYNSVLVYPGEKIYVASTTDGDGNEIKIYRRPDAIIKSINQIMNEEGISEKEAFTKYGTFIFEAKDAQSSIRGRVIDAKLQNNITDDIVSIEYIPKSGKNKGKIYEQFYKGDKCRLFAWLKDISEVIDGMLYKKDAQGTYWDLTQYINNLSKEGDIAFPNGKKPIALMERMIRMVTSEDSIILDFFSGSASTAHAVMHQNFEDGGHRKFIMVQLPEETPEDSEARKDGYMNICEMGKERIRRAGKQIKDASPLTTQDLDTGFRVLKIDDSNFKEVSFAAKDYTQAELAGLIDNIKEDRSDLDLLFDCMLRWGVELSLPIVRSEADHCHILNVNDGDLVACLAPNETITEAVIDAIAAMHPLRIVLRDTAFEEASQKMNIYELFKQRLGWSDDQASKQIRVI